MTQPDSAPAAAEVESLCINTLRLLAVDAVQKANSGHPGLPMGAAPMAYTLWDRFLKHNPANPAWPDRDRFVLSAGHGSMLLYALLHLAGYPLALTDLENFRQWGSLTPGHPEYGHTPGVETTSGPLGQGFANAVGMAIAEAHLAARFNRPGHQIIDHFTYVLAGDGDLMEGISAEAASLAGHLGLGKLICLYDSNRISLAAATDLTFTEDSAARFEAYGWQVQTVADGNDTAAIAAALAAAREETSRPSLVVVRTHIGFGSPHKQDTFAAHGAPLGEEEVVLTKQALGWPAAPPFFVPGTVRERFGTARERGRTAEAEWRGCLAAYRAAFPQEARELEESLAGNLPAGWEEALPVFAADAKGMATRVASGKVLAAIAPHLPLLIGGSADLNPSTHTALAGAGDFQPPDRPAADPQGAVGGPWSYAGRNLHFGVREHAMGGILNGLAVHGGAIPFGATFLVFSDYLRPALRLAALMRQRVIHVFTHDSLAVGEDGPTHQPVEQLAALRAIPGLTVIRPADANETAVAWKTALTSRNRPTALILSRQNLPVFDRERCAPAAGAARGGYVLLDAAGGAPQMILIATGSEVALAVAAAEKLAARGAAVRVVSLPSWELFEEQSAAYREEVLPAAVSARLAIEAGVPFGWCRYVGAAGAVLGVESFGASAPGAEVLARYGFTVENVCARALALLGRKEKK